MPVKELSFIKSEIIKRTHDVTVDLQPKIAAQMNDGILAQPALLRARRHVDVHVVGRIESNGPHFSTDFIAFSILVRRRYSQRFGISRHRKLSIKNSKIIIDSFRTQLRTYAIVVDASASKLAEFSIFRLSIHPVREFIGQLVVLTTPVAHIFTCSRDDNLGQILQLPIGVCDGRPEDDAGRGQLLRRQGLIVVVHDVDMPFERHSRFENGRFHSGKTEFQLSADDASLDKRTTRFTHKVTVHCRSHADHPAGQTPGTHRTLHAIQTDLIGKIVRLRAMKIQFKVKAFKNC